MKSITKNEMVKDSMNLLSFDVTRRCNLNCKWCCKGDAQNADISNDIVDKAIDEMSGVYIDFIRFFGGEPLLNPDMIEYIIDKLIERHILFGHINLFSNGTIKSEKVVAAFKKAIAYMCEIENEIKYMKERISKLLRTIPDNIPENKKDKIKDKKITMILSGGENCNSNHKEVDATLKFYTDSVGDAFGAIDVYTDNGFNYVVDFEGKAELNYLDLIDVTQPLDLRLARKIINQYCIIKSWANEPEKRFITKSLSVSTDGNVYVGCSMPYERIEKEAMFKIQECNGDFFDKVENWCYNHNVSSKANNIREGYKLISFCRDRNIPVKNASENNFKVLELHNSFVNAQEKIAADEHILCRNLSLDEIECMSIATLCLKLMENGASLKTIQEYLNCCTDFDADNILKASPDYFRGLIAWLSEQNNK